MGLTCIAIAVSSLIACGGSDTPPADAGDSASVLDSSAGDSADDTAVGLDSGGADGRAGDAGATGCPIGPCDLVAQTGCGPGQGCYLASEGPRCGAAGIEVFGGSCASDADCGAGLTCVGSICVSYSHLGFG
ncbi:MAG: hypothetical protein JRH11_08630 [Deltaproteobacteria bacterium]|nr:hypothetical protein [Deltaproteobacteria bacterium]